MIHIEQYGKRNLILFGRDKIGKRTIQHITNFRPYFYNDKKEKVFVDTPSDVPQVRKNYSVHYEADIPYPIRYLVDEVPIPIPEEQLRICYLDIETDNACLETEKTPEPIICICCYDNFLKRYVTFVWREDLPNRKLDKTEEYSVYYYNNEKDMLLQFIKFIKSTDPDVLCGWAIDRYDMTYIINRCQTIGLGSQLQNLSPLKQVSIKQFVTKSNFKVNSIIVRGRAIIDLQKGYKQIFGELSSYSLAYVSQKELGVSKEKHLKEFYKDINKLIEYNRNDVKLTVLLNEKLMIVGFYDALRRVVGCTWDYTKVYSNMVDVLLLREAKHVRKEILPSKPEGKEAARIKGGLVLETKPGVHTGVIVLDTVVTYPAIVREFNISSDTIVPEGEIKLGNGVQFTNKKIGIMPSIIEKMIQHRMVYKNKMKQYKYGSTEYNTLYNIQFALKCVINAGCYGAVKYERYRLFNPRVAESITWVGRELAKWSAKIIEKEGYEVIYCDTDSTFIKTNETDLNKLLEIQEKLLRIVNDSYGDFVKQFGVKQNKYLQMDLDRIYSKLFFSKAKKRYAGQLLYANEKPTNELHTMGFEPRRSDFNVFGKKIQLKIFEMVLGGKSQKEITEFLTQVKKDFMRIQDLNDICIPKSLVRRFDQYLTKSAYVRGAEYANKYLGEQFSAGDKMRFLYVTNVKGKPSTNVVSYSEDPPTEIEVDWEKMWRLTVTNKVNRIYEAMGWGEFSEYPTLERWLT